MQNCRNFVAEVLNLFLLVLGSLYRGSKTKKRSAGVGSLVVGIKYHRGHVDGIAQGDSVRLMRQPNNAYDPNAIQVNLQTGKLSDTSQGNSPPRL